MNTKTTNRFSNFFRVVTALLLIGGFPLVSQAHESASNCSNCPFCSAINLTFAEQIGSNDVVAIARMIEAPKYEKPDGDELPKARFEIEGVVKGAAFAKPGMQFNTILVGSYEVGQKFVVMGVDPPNVVWSTPLKASQRVIDYVHALQNLPASGSDRLVFFQDYFEDAESLLAFDAYDEFARAPYSDVQDLKDRMKREQILKWIQNPEIAVNRRRLYFTMLGVCGTDEDIPMLEEMIKSGDRQKQAGLDALVGCYMVLKGESALPLIEKQLLEKEDIDYVDTLSAVSAIRFMGTESTLIPRERLCQSLRSLLKRPSLADMIVPDLARWEDWSVMDRLVELFKEAEGDTVWLRVAIFQYLQVCPLPKAKEHLAALAKIDPKAFERASFFSDFGFSDSGSTDSGKTDKSDDKTDDKTNDQDEPPGFLEELAGDLGDQSVLHPVSTGSPLAGVIDPSHGNVADAQDSQTPSATPELEEVATDGEKDPVAEIDPVQAETRTVFKPPVPGDASAAAGAVAAEPKSPAVEPEIAASPVARLEAGATVPLQPVSRFYSLLLPVGSGMAIFLLLWSVINGWFERLVF